MKLLHLPFFVPCITMWFADTVTTLAGQPKGYWRGDYSQAHELNPLFRPLLVIGPWAFVLAAVSCFAVLAVVVRRLNVKMASTILFLATLIHFFGAATWVIQTERYGIYLVVILGLVIKIQTERDWRRFAAIRSANQASQPTQHARRDPASMPDTPSV